MTGNAPFDNHDLPLLDSERFTAGDVETLLYGLDRTPRLVAAEFRSPNRILLYQRAENGQTRLIERSFRPWLIARDADALQNLRPAPATSPLRGAETHPLSTLVEFESWEHFRGAHDLLPSRSRGIYRIESPVSQYLMRTGITLFQDMIFEDLRRLQLDIETLGLNPRDDDGAIVMIALKQGDYEELLFLETDERDLLLRFSEAIQRLDPDVIEGHNVFNFDLPYLVERARRWQIPLRLGRDGSVSLPNTERLPI